MNQYFILDCRFSPNILGKVGLLDNQGGHYVGKIQPTLQTSKKKKKGVVICPNILVKSFVMSSGFGRNLPSSKIGVVGSLCVERTSSLHLICHLFSTYFKELLGS